MAYTKLSKRWFFPALYYTETVSLSGGGSLQFVFIDTVLLCGQTHPTLRDLPPTGPASVAAAEDQWAWIEQTLSTSTADWLIVAGHYPGQCTAEDLHYSLPLPLDLPSLSPPFPLTLLHFPNAVWSIGEHGPTSELVERLRPLLFKYRVSAYFCGHDHSMQHLREANTTLDYFLVGAGHLTDPSQIHKVKWLEHTSSHLPHLSVTWPLPLPMQMDVPKDSLHFWYAPLDPLDEHGAFATVSVDQHSLTTTYYSGKGGRGRAGQDA